MECESMSFFRRSKPNRPKPETYQERLRAIGRKLDDDHLRFATLVELPDGFLLKAEQLAARGAGEAATWTPHTIRFNDSDVTTLVDASYEQRGEKRDRR
jgi:hypothetical protein